MNQLERRIGDLEQVSELPNMTIEQACEEAYAAGSITQSESERFKFLTAKLLTSDEGLSKEEDKEWDQLEGKIDPLPWVDYSTI